MVVLVAQLLGVDCNYDTLNCKDVALLSCHVILVRVYVVLGNLEVEGNGCCCAIACLDGSGELVSNLFGGLFVNADGNLAVSGLANCYLVGVNCPGDLILNACDHNLGYYGVVNCCDRKIFLIETFYVSSRAFKVILDFGLLGCVRAASCKHCESEHCDEQKCKKLFHNVSFVNFIILN